MFIVSKASTSFGKMFAIFRLNNLSWVLLNLLTVKSIRIIDYMYDYTFTSACIWLWYDKWKSNIIYKMYILVSCIFTRISNNLWYYVYDSDNYLCGFLRKKIIATVTTATTRRKQSPATIPIVETPKVAADPCNAEEKSINAHIKICSF